MPELCGLLCEEYIVGFVILTVDINVSASLVRTMYYFIYRKDHGELLTSKSPSSTYGTCSFVFSVFDAFLTTLFPVEKNNNNNNKEQFHELQIITRMTEILDLATLLFFFFRNRNRKSNQNNLTISYWFNKLNIIINSKL